ncbi:MAG: hypothetical protein ACKVS9_01695 [Phycisphaerae bacterium]
MNNKKYRQAVLTTSIVAAGGIVHQCSPSGLINVAGQINPCGTILNCDPNAYNVFVRGIEDPFCTFPPFCTTGDPILP